MRTALIIAASVLLGGCASDLATSSTTLVSEFYHPVIGTKGSTNKVEPQYVDASSETEARRIYQRYLSERYHLVGFTSFACPDIPALYPLKTRRHSDQARRVRAEVVLYFSVPQGREPVNAARGLGGFTWEF